MITKITNHKLIKMQTITENKEFTFYIDQKITMWTRSTKHIEAKTYEEAESIMKKQIEDGEIFEDLDEYDYLYETQQDCDVIEILNQDGNQINK